MTRLTYRIHGAAFSTRSDEPALTVALVLADQMRTCRLITDAEVRGDDGEHYHVTGEQVWDARSGAVERRAA